MSKITDFWWTVPMNRSSEDVNSKSFSLQDNKKLYRSRHESSAHRLDTKNKYITNYLQRHMHNHSLATHTIRVSFLVLLQIVSNQSLYRKHWVQTYTTISVSDRRHSQFDILHGKSRRHVDIWCNVWPWPSMYTMYNMAFDLGVLVGDSYVSAKLFDYAAIVVVHFIALYRQSCTPRSRCNPPS